MTNDKIHLCNMTSLDDIPKNKSNDDLTVLRALERVGRASTFELSERIALGRTIERLKAVGWVKEQQAAYPWHKFVVTRKGKAAIAEMAAVAKRSRQNIPENITGHGE